MRNKEINILYFKKKIIFLQDVKLVSYSACYSRRRFYKYVHGQTETGVLIYKQKHFMVVINEEE